MKGKISWSNEVRRKKRAEFEQPVHWRRMSRCDLESSLQSVTFSALISSFLTLFTDTVKPSRWGPGIVPLSCDHSAAPCWRTWPFGTHDATLVETIRASSFADISHDDRLEPTQTCLISVSNASNNRIPQSLNEPTIA